MCGIVGIVNHRGEPVDPGVLTRMRDAMVHRGPDDAGLFIDAGIGLGHRRLSILDLSRAGHQPMANEDETLWLVFNGEIFNYVELTEELKSKGHRFRSTSDSEVILHLYEELGSACLERLNGMFAFAVWDASRRTLFAARDRLGIKPFYYSETPSSFVFASEVKAILAAPGVSAEPEPRAIADYLFCGQPLGSRTFFRGISELPPGCALEVKDGRVRRFEYWKLRYDYDEGRSDADLIEELAALLDDAVRIHCRSDAEVGCHLSGGFDSSTVACLTTRHRGPVKSFSIRSPGGAYFDETRYAKAVSRHAGTEYLETSATHQDIDAMVTRLLWHMDMPMPTAGGVNYHVVSRLAAQHVKVALTGHGGDEVFAGYPAQFEVAYGSTDMFDQSARPARVEPSLAFRLKTQWRRYGVAGLVRRLWSRAAAPAATPEALWLRAHCGRAAGHDPQLDPGFVESLEGYRSEDAYLEAFRQAPTPELLDRCLHHDLRCYLPSLLFMEDRASMAVSLESRVPLLDYRIAEFAARVRPEQKVRDRAPKHLLREAAQGWLPAEVVERRDKAGFPMPVDRWFANELSGPAHAILASAPSRARGVFLPAALSHPDFAIRRGWAALNLELWFRIFVDGTLSPGTALSAIE